MNSFDIFSTFIILILCPAAYQTTLFNETISVERHKRALLFPTGGTFKMVIGVVTPVKLSKTRTIAVGWNFQYQYVVPTNTTAISTYPPILSRRSIQDHDLGIKEIYNSLEDLLIGHHINLKDCLLRYICEEGYSSFNHDQNGIYGNILHSLLSPDGEQNVDSTYLDARNAGKYGAECTTLYSRCDESFLFNSLFPLSFMKKQ